MADPGDTYTLVLDLRTIQSCLAALDLSLKTYRRIELEDVSGFQDAFATMDKINNMIVFRE